MNFSTFIVKLIDNPIQTNINSKTSLTEVSAIIATKFKKQKRKLPIIKLCAWGDLSTILMDYYQKHDLLVIEGLISLRENPKKTSGKMVEITLISFYPYELEAK